MRSSQDNLKAAFAGESQANRRYLFYARKADEEGYPQVARLFRAAAESETVHARNHLQTLGEIKSTTENLKAALAGEYHEFTRMYPDFIAQAKAEKKPDAETTFDWANKVEKIHHGLYQKALDAVVKKQPLKDEPYFVCQNCGYTVGSKAPDKCPVCGASRDQFKKVE